jgi:hypothetical protein
MKTIGKCYLGGEVERYLLVGQLSINGGVRVGASLHVGLIPPVEVDLDDASAVDLASRALAGDLGGVDDVLEDGVLNGREGARARAKSGRLLGTGVALSEDVPLSDDDDVTSGELLLELAHETGLDLLERLLELVRHVHDDGLATGAAVDLLRRGDVQVAQGRLELGGGHLEVEELLCHLSLEFVRLLRAGNV